MKRFIYILIAIVMLLVLFGYLFLQSTQPTYSGNLSLKGLHEKVEVKYDAYGIPHIYARNEHDAYMALGYVHAQERLFQMEMIRRVATGTLAEILGPDLLKVDKLFRTLGVAQKSKEFVKQYEALNAPYKIATDAYFGGINEFIHDGPTPIEFRIIGIPKREFSVEDAYNAAGYMSFGFAEGFKVDPVLSVLVSKYGEKYLNDLAIDSPNDSARIQSFPHMDSAKLTSLAQAIEQIPIPLLVGSNSWIIGPGRTKSGKPVFENDTHIGYSQPSVWFEAHLEYPGMSHYGHYIAGIPFSLLGHNRLAAIGLTMFENDDVDFYKEKTDKEHPNQIWHKDHWEKLTSRTEIIPVKDSDPDTLLVRTSSHGPIVNDIYFKQMENKSPVSVWWSSMFFKEDILAAVYQLNHIASLDDARKGASMIEAPGLNVMYADTAGNIAWWASARLPVRPEHINTKLVLNGSSGEDDYLEFYDFSKNPQAENPPWDYVYSANNQPDSVDGVLYPGYYFPKDRAGHIVDLIDEKTGWTAEDSKQMANDVTSGVQSELAHLMASLLKESNTDVPQEIVERLQKWNGDHQKDAVEPSIHYTLAAWLAYYTLADELGYENMQTLSSTSLLKSSYIKLFSNPNSVWWDDIKTPEKETRDDIVRKSASSALKTLKKNFESSSPQDWKWAKIHTLTHNHPLGQVETLKRYFSVGPFDIQGGNETINNQMFKLDTTGVFSVIAGPAVRTVIDLSNMNGAESINPTGQSGNFLSPHYSDQAQMFVNTEFRPQLMDSLQITDAAKSTLILTPDKN